MRQSHFYKILKSNRPVMVSAAAHLVALGALGSLAVSQSQPAAAILYASWQETPSPLDLITLDLKQPQPAAGLAGEEGRAEPLVAVSNSLPATTIAVPDFGNQSASPPLAMTAENLRLLPQPRLATGQGAGSAGLGAAVGQRLGTGRGSTFFGIRSTEQRVVYVLDASLSMEGARWNRLLQEMTETLSSLDEEMEFSIVFFNTRFQEIQGGLQLATEQHKNDAIVWMRNHRTGGRTNPLPALLRALEMQPDAIYFLTDGDFQDFAVTRTLGRIKRQQKKTSIHSIALGNPAGNAKLFYLARATGGQFLFINR